MPARVPAVMVLEVASHAVIRTEVQHTTMLAKTTASETGQIRFLSALLSQQGQGKS